MTNNFTLQIPLDAKAASIYNNYEFNSIRLRGVLADQKEDVAKNVIINITAIIKSRIVPF